MKNFFTLKLVVFLFVCSGFLPLFPADTDAALAKQVSFIKTLNYRLDISIDYKKELITGNCRMTISNSGDASIHKVPLLLYRLMTVERIKTAEGKELAYSQRVTQFVDWRKYQANFIVVTLPAPLNKGERTLLDIDYSGHLLGYSETGMMYVKDRVDENFTIIRPDCRAYPSVGYTSWKVNRKAGMQTYDYEIHVTAPESKVVANGGQLLDKKIKDGKATYSYKNIKPAWRIDIAVAEYKIVTGPGGGLKIFCFPRHEQGARKVMIAMEKAVVLYTKWFGPLKGAKNFSVLELPSGYGSQADVTSILQVEEAFSDKGEMRQFYHELSHLWNVKMLDPFPCRFESEGLAMFLQYLVEEKLDQAPGAVQKAFQRYSKGYAEKFKKKPGYLDIAMIDHGKKQVTGLSYSKGLLFFTILHKLVGEEAFLSIIKDFYQKYEKGATTQQFADHLNAYEKTDLSRFAADWIIGTQSNKDLLNRLSLEDYVKKYRGKR
jgi:hypothetical protein